MNWSSVALDSVSVGQNMRLKHYVQNMAGQNCDSTAKPFRFSEVLQNGLDWVSTREQVPLFLNRLPQDYYC